MTESKDGAINNKIYRLDKLEKNLLENFLTARNQAMLFSKSNIDANGKPTIVDPDNGKPIYITDGVIPQCEAYCSKYAYNKMNLGVLQTAISMLNEKANDETGNSYVFVCNGKFWQDLQSTLGDYLAQFHTDGTYLWSKAANDYVKVGAKGYDSYNWGGKQWYCFLKFAFMLRTLKRQSAAKLF